MPQMTSKTPRFEDVRSRQNTATGQAGAAVSPPRYGIDFVDRESHELDAVRQERAPADTMQPKRTTDIQALDAFYYDPWFEQRDTENLDKVENRTLEKPSSASVSSGLLQRASLSPHDREIEGKEEAPPIVHEVLRSSGQPLDSATRAFFEPRFGYDFSQVRVHTDVKAAESARAVSALAYTVGRDVVFGARQHAPYTSGGQKLMAHELTHVIQQTDSLIQGKLTLSMPGDQYEKEAEQTAQAVIKAEPLFSRTEGTAGATHRQGLAIKNELLAGRYAPKTDHGRHLIAHELTHVVQQGADVNARRASIVQREKENEPFSSGDEKRRFFNKVFEGMDTKNAKIVEDENSKQYDGWQFIVTPAEAYKFEMEGDKVEKTERLKKLDDVENAVKKDDFEKLPKPVVEELPKYTHINGILTPLRVGIHEARVLSEDLGGEPVLFTYNASEGLGSDVVQCISDKLLGTGLFLPTIEGDIDKAFKDLPIDTKKQVELIRSAVVNQKPIYMSAFSQGSVKLNTALKFAIRERAILNLKYFKYFKSFFDAEKAASDEVSKFVNVFYSGDPVADPVKFATRVVAYGDVIHGFGTDFKTADKFNIPSHVYSDEDALGSLPALLERSSHDFSLGERLKGIGDKLNKIGTDIQSQGEKLKEVLGLKQIVLGLKQIVNVNYNVVTIIRNLDDLIDFNFNNTVLSNTVLLKKSIAFRSSLDKTVLDKNLEALKTANDRLSERKLQQQNIENTVNEVESKFMEIGKKLEKIGQTLWGHKSIYSHAVAKFMTLREIGQILQTKFGKHKESYDIWVQIGENIEDVERLREILQLLRTTGEDKFDDVKRKVVECMPVKTSAIPAQNSVTL